LSNKVLQAAHLLAQPKHHLFNILAYGIAQQAIHIGLAALHLFYPSKGGANCFIYFVNSFEKRSTSVLFKLHSGRVGCTGFKRLGSMRFGYNLFGHGVLGLLPTWPWSEKDTMPSYSRLLNLPVSNFAL